MTLFFPQVSLLPIERYTVILGARRMQEIALRIADLRVRLEGRAVWNISSSFVGGGVAEMVRSLLAYARGADVDARWVVIRGTPEFFKVTKRLHNAIHGTPGDGSPLGEAERQVYERINQDCVNELTPLIRPRDVVIVHDPQPAGMIKKLSRLGAHIIWRCHIGTEIPNAETQLGWRFLEPYLREISAYVFSRAQYVPTQLDSTRATIIPPSLDPFSAKNQNLSEDAIRSILVHAGILEAPVNGNLPCYVREDGTPGRVDRYADVLRLGPPPGLEIPLIAQVSRWDKLKDPIGVMRGFALGEGPMLSKAHLLLAGPNTRTVADDPEDVKVYRESVDVWRSLPESIRKRIHLVSLPTVDVDENAAMVNAIQRHAAVVVQKSVHEGFGLTVTEAMWKKRPVVASAIGGIQDQIDDGIQGLLLQDPCDLQAFSNDLERLLSDHEFARKLGENGHLRVLERYLGIDSLLHYGALIEKLDSSAFTLRGRDAA